MLEKNMKKIKVFIVLVLAILITLIAFLGIFKFKKGVWNNIIPAYKYGMDIAGSREIRYEVDNSENEKYVYVDENGNVMGNVWKDGSSITAEDEASSTEEGQATDNNEETKENEENEVIPYSKETRTIKTNSEDALTKENFEEVKKIIQKRLDDQKISEYNIRIDDVTGKIVVEISNDNDEVENAENIIGQVGKFKIIDYQNGLELMNNDDIKNISVVYSNKDSFSTYLQIEFDKEGAEKLREISKKYVEIKKETDEEKTETTNEDEENEKDDETTKKMVSIVLDDSTIMTTYFGEEMTQGILQIQIGEATKDTEKFLENQKSARRIATVLNSGILPIKYNIETDNFVKSEITNDVFSRAKIIFGVAIIVVSIVLVLKFKLNGVFVAILNVGYISLLSLVIRYTNVQITLNSMVSAIFVILMDYIFITMMLKEIQENNTANAFSKSFKSFCLTTLPVFVIAIVFTLTTSLQISSIGMILFWGMILIALYNAVFTKTVFNNINNK